MFIIDDILLSPAKGFMWIVRELHNAAQQEIKGEAERLTHKLSTLYMLLETGGISAEEFDQQEQQILARLDELEGDQAAEADTDDAEASDENEDDGEEEDDTTGASASDDTGQEDDSDDSDDGDEQDDDGQADDTRPT